MPPGPAVAILVAAKQTRSEYHAEKWTPIIWASTACDYLLHGQVSERSMSSTLAACRSANRSSIRLMIMKALETSHANTIRWPICTQETHIEQKTNLRS